MNDTPPPAVTAHIAVSHPAKPRGLRIDAIDLARTIAILAMVVFHFTFDLAAFGHIPPETPYSGFWPYFARMIAASFLVLAGLSLWLAHGQGIRWRGFWKRWRVLVLAALVITIATYFGMPDQYIRWGILHMIAAGSLIGLAFLRLPLIVVVLAALACFAAPHLFASQAFASPWLIWLGLAPSVPLMMDYEPLLPWLSPVLAGIALGRIGGHFGLWQFLWGWRLPAWITWPGRYSLWIYLAHQPVLFGLLILYARFG